MMMLMLLDKEQIFINDVDDKTTEYIQVLHELIGSELYVDCEVVKYDDCYATLALPMMMMMTLMMWIICSEITGLVCL